MRTCVSLDLETTGLDSTRDAIIEIGAVKFRDDDILESFQTMVNPERSIPYKVQQLTGISDADVQNAPPLSQALFRLHKFVGDAPVVGHNINFDLEFIRRHSMLLDNPGMDTFELASILMPYAPQYSLYSLAKSQGLAIETEHRALDDARLAQQFFLKLKELALNLGLDVLSEVSALAARSDWSLSLFFMDLARERARRAFDGSLGAQLKAKLGARQTVGTMLDEERGEPLSPSAAISPLDVEALAGLLREGGKIARKFPNFEFRSQQVDMMEEVAKTFNEGGHLLAEAGTGIGKSLAYLLPAIHWALQNGRRVVISTNTINLQDQLLQKDIPALKEMLGIDFTAVCLKGRSNYICPARVEKMKRRKDLSPLELRLLAKVLVWLPGTLTGDRQELFMPDKQEQALWGQLSSDPEICPASRCARERCFFYRVRMAAEEAHIIIVNHALLLADVATNNSVIPAYEYLIVDEAHQLEDNVTRQLGFALEERGSERLIAEIHRASKKEAQADFLGAVQISLGQASALKEREKRQKIFDETREASVEADRNIKAFFRELQAFMEEHGTSNGQYSQRLRLNENMRIQPSWSNIELAGSNFKLSVSDLRQRLEKIDGLLADQETRNVTESNELATQGTSLQRRLQEVEHQLDTTVEHPNKDFVVWCEQVTGNREIALNAAPIHVGGLVRRHLFEVKKSVILTSATLRTNNNFEYLRERLHAWDAEELTVGSPFDYKQNTMLYLPTDMPEPSTAGYQRAVERTLTELCIALNGRTLALFTSYNQLKNTAAAIREPLAEKSIILLEQGDGTSRRQLLESFRSIDHAVLLGTRSFWEGVDIPGQALSCLVITRLPFFVPTDPVYSARAEQYEDPFNQYSVPEAIMRFRQGFGRLIRTKNDRGIVVVLDRRISSKKYGEAFVESLPECALVRGLLATLPGRAQHWLEQGDNPAAPSAR